MRIPHKYQIKQPDAVMRRLAFVWNLLFEDKIHRLSAQNLVYKLGEDVHKVAYTFLMCKAVH